MSETQPDSSGPRRSQRDKKTVQPFVSNSGTSTARKRKREDIDTENDAPDTSDAEHIDSEEDAEPEGEEEDEQKTPRAQKSKAKSSPKTTPKKPRKEKNTLPKIPKVKARRGRKPKDTGEVYDPDQVAKETKILADNPLFNAIMNPASALQSSAEDFLESFQQSPERALAELINLVLRSCGCNDSVDPDQVVDYDGIVSTLDDFTEVLKQENSPVYPLTSKLPAFKRFRKSLSEWIERLIVSASALGVLYSSQLMETLQQWVVSMSSSQIRSFRHTATVVALEAETALCDVAAMVDKESHVIARQREGEKKRKGKGGNVQLDTKAKEVKQRQNKLKTFLKEFVDGVFVHRFRDLDFNIRSECIRALGQWLKKYPEQFLDTNYLRYLGWVLSDSDNHVRLEAVKSLSGVYEQTEYLHSVTNFTDRFKARLLEMATSDIDLSIRVAVIRVLSDIESHFPLEEEEKEKLCLLLFDEEPRARRAVSSFVKTVWEEEVEEKLGTLHKPSEKDISRIGAKILADLLVKWGKALDNISGDAAESEIGDGDTENSNGRRQSKRRKELIALVAAEDRGRISMAVEALWDDVDSISDWESLLELLLLDHSASEDETSVGPSRGRPRVNGKTHKADFCVHESWRLEEAEETVLIEVLVSSIRMAKDESVGGKKGEAENVSNDITRALIKGLPRLFLKHQSDSNRIAELLILPTLMNLDLYLEMRMIAAYSSLWDDVIKQFTSHSSSKVLTHAMAAIRYFMDTTSLSNANSTKILELEDELSTQLRDLVAGREDIEITTFSEDEVLALSGWCMRLSVLAGARNMTAWTEEDEGGKQSSAWDIVSALVERGRLGYKEEESLVERSLQVLTLHVLWKTKGLPIEDDLTPEEVRYKDVMREQRESLLEKLTEYAIGTQSNTVEGVKRGAFKHFLDLHVLFTPVAGEDASESTNPLAPFSLTLDEELQYRCAGYVQAEIERYAEFLDESGEGEDVPQPDENSEQEDATTGEGEATPKPLRTKKKVQKEARVDARDLLEREYLFIDVVSTFLRAIRAGTIRIQHGATVLAHHGRLEVAFDTCSKIIVDILREERIMVEKPELVTSVVTQAIQEAFSLVLDGVVPNEENAVQLAKLLSTCLVVRGSQLSILRRLPSPYVVQIQTNLLSWITKKITGYEKNNNKKGLKTAILFFRVLVPLLNALVSADALKIKAYLDQSLELAKVDISNSKIWEPQKTYEKKLSSILAKENPQAPKAKRTRKKAGTGEEETDGETAHEGGGGGGSKDKAQHIRKSNRRTRSNPSGGQDESTGDDEPYVPVTPTKAKPRPRPRPIRPRQKTPPSNAVVVAGAEEEEEVVDDHEDDHEDLVQPGSDKTPSRMRQKRGNHQMPALSSSSPERPATGTISPPSSSRKRPRSEELDVEDALMGRESAPGSPEVPDIEVRRKRARH